MSKNTQLAKPPQVVMVVDFGGSSTKIIFAGPDGKLRAFTMEPEVARVTGLARLKPY